MTTFEADDVEKGQKNEDLANSNRLRNFCYGNNLKAEHGPERSRYITLAKRAVLATYSSIGSSLIKDNNSERPVVHGLE
jgi:hypothetical protein